MKNRCSQNRKIAQNDFHDYSACGLDPLSPASSETPPSASKRLPPPQCDERSTKTWLRGLTRSYERPNANLRSGKHGRSVRSPSGRGFKVVELKKSGPDGAVGFSDLRTVWP